MKELEKAPKRRGRGERRRSRSAEERDGIHVLVEEQSGLDANALRDLSDQVRQKLGDAVVVLGSATDGRVHLVVNVAPAAVERGVKAGDIVRAAAPVVGGGGGGRDTLAQAGGRDPEKLDEALPRRARRRSRRRSG